MLLVIDVGNTNTVLGLYAGGVLKHSWRIRSDKARTADEYAVLFGNLFALQGLRLEQVRAVMISCVVPPLLDTLQRLCRSYFALEPGLVGPQMKTGMTLCYDNPQEVGADRIVNAVAAYHKHRCSLIVVDFGTATTFDYICPAGSYQGGAIAPGLAISANALHDHASKLPRVALQPPPQVVAKNTVHSIQAGLLFGYAGLVDGIVRRMAREVATTPKVVATGGLARQIAGVSETIEEVDDLLTLDGLFLLHQLNP
ncbi:MAG: type III pantothenate kinase [Desulfuromonas thiophila]|jgi:type III pantothenate kinase|uniref:type III pantothenate kinase n=1 Tax=Desulfuromonas thiophila TaxID=57664 RepID=UPI0024A94CE4|nr:type III pantothenate kinase [Desulfuromonas thiophila]MCK9172955.1 type III pantothenate kinase [Desulfuromonas thiophila]MDD3801044.1 type III pantothenate kinase [Desulfuromonas thiophila]